MYTVYVVRCRDGSLYTGIARDPTERLAAHNAGRGARYTRSRRPVRLVYGEPARDRSSALRREHTIKRLPREAKLRLIRRATSAGTDFSGFRPPALDFFRRLSRRNTREWFEAHRPMYEQEVRAPFRALIEEMDVRLARLAPELMGDPRRSMFRIHRDIRFSKDKSPYKTNAGVWFFHRDAGKGVGAEAKSGGAGFYLHLSAEECFVAGGVWMPAREALQKIRAALADDRAGFERIVRGSGFRGKFGGLDEDAMLKRLPRGVAADHPAAHWLRYQSFTAHRMLSRREILSPKLPAMLARDFRSLLPLVRWLNVALGYRAAVRR